MTLFRSCWKNLLALLEQIVVLIKRTFVIDVKAQADTSSREASSTLGSLPTLVFIIIQITNLKIMRDSQKDFNHLDSHYREEAKLPECSNQKISYKFKKIIYIWFTTISCQQKTFGFRSDMASDDACAMDDRNLCNVFRRNKQCVQTKHSSY